MKQGYFFTFEGIDGCGKSTQIAKVAEALTAQGVKCIVTREPGGGDISERIREIILAPQYVQMTNATELLLYLASRAQHVSDVIKPALDSGAVVLCDRFSEATFAYQGYGRGLNVDFLHKANDFACAGIEPDLTFIFDITVAESIARLEMIGKGKDRLESAGGEFFERVRQGYLESAGKNKKIVLLDGAKSVEELTELVMQKIKKII